MWREPAIPGEVRLWCSQKRPGNTGGRGRGRGMRVKARARGPAMKVRAAARGRVQDEDFAPPGPQASPVRSLIVALGALLRTDRMPFSIAAVDV